MKFYIVDVFAEEKYRGNQLLVLKADSDISDSEQQEIAREIGFSETAFILSDKKDDGGYDVRIWTPNVGEVPFAGHPTLGTAYVIHSVLEEGKSDVVRLDLKVGQIPVRAEGELLTMSQNPPVFGETVSRQEIAEVFGIDAESIREDMPIQHVSTGLAAVLIPLKDRETLSRVRTDRDAFERYLKKHPGNYCSHFFFTDLGDHTFAARCMTEDFSEDAATGSANGDLAGYLVKHGWFDSDDISYTVIQGEDMGRRSVLHIHASLKEDVWTIEVGGSTYLIAEGDWK